MSATDVKIVHAAIQAFAETGVRGTNMTRVAKAAGVSRQTLYAHFGTKDDLLVAVMQQVVADILTDLRAAWAEDKPFAAKLDDFFALAIIAPFEVMQRHPDLKDLLLGVGQRTAEVARQADQDKAAALAGLLAGHGPALAQIGATPAGYGAFIANVSKQLKYTCTGRAELDQNLALLKASVLAVIAKTQSIQ